MSESSPERVLAEQLRECGSLLPESDRPAPADVPAIIAGLIYYLETGTTQAPDPTPEANVPSPEADRIAQLEAELADARKAKPAPAQPSKVAPAPPAAAPAPPVSEAS